MIIFLLSILREAGKFLLSLRIKLVKMKFGCNWLRKLGPRFVEVTKHQKWEGVGSSLRILMAIHAMCIGQMIMKTNVDKKNYSGY